MHMLIRTFMTTISREFVDARYWPRTVVIDTGNYSLLEFRIDRAQKEHLYRMGYETTRRVLPLKFDGCSAFAAARGGSVASLDDAMT